MKMKSRFLRKTSWLLITALLIIPFLNLTLIVAAHSPSSMSLSYDADANELLVSIGHSVSDPSAHYVNKIEIKINGEINRTEEYSSQDGSSFSYTYGDMVVESGDVIEVTASCNQGGSITKQLTIGSDDTSSNGDGSTPGFELVFVLLSIMVIIGIIRKKQFF